jgi:thymidylate synthase
MFAAWPANAMGLRALQKHIRNEICQRSQYDLKLGPLITLSQSAHIYDDTWSNAEQLIKEQYSAICKKLDYYDPAGNFLIEIADDKIVVTHTTPGSGEIVGCYSGKNPLKMIKEICAASPSVCPDHAGYLGMELQKASECLTNGIEYIQDR